MGVVGWIWWAGLLLAVGIGMWLVLARSYDTADAPEATTDSLVASLLDLSAVAGVASSGSEVGVVGSEESEPCELGGGESGVVDRATATVEVGDADVGEVLGRVEEFWRGESDDDPPVEVAGISMASEKTLQGEAAGSTLSATVEGGQLALVAVSTCRPR